MIDGVAINLGWGHNCLGFCHEFPVTVAFPFYCVSYMGIKQGTLCWIFAVHCLDESLGAKIQTCEVLVCSHQIWESEDTFNKILRNVKHLV